jgi:hypothetical protein
MPHRQPAKSADASVFMPVHDVESGCPVGFPDIPAFAWRIYVFSGTVIDLLTAGAMIFFLPCGL